MLKKSIVWTVIMVALAIGTTSLAFSKEKKDAAKSKGVEFAAAQSILNASNAAAVAPLDARSDIDNCSGDSTCIAHVLLRAIRNNGGSGGTNTVHFYNSDRCDQSEYIRPVRMGISVAACEALGQRIRDRVWGIRYQGQGCVDISDKDFDDACIMYAAEL